MLIAMVIPNKRSGVNCRSSVKLKSLVYVLLVTSLFLAACTQNTDLALYANQTWRANSQFSYDPRSIELIERVTPLLLEAFDIAIPFNVNLGGVDQTVVEMALNTLVTSNGNIGINTKWRQTRHGPQNITYAINMQGRSYAQLEQFLPGMLTITEQAPDQYCLHMVLGNSNVYASALYQQRFTLHVGKILSSNAPEQHGGVATWYNPSEIDIVFTPRPPISSTLLGIMGALVAGGLLALIIRSVRWRGAIYCYNCGARISKTAEYCPVCNFYTGYGAYNLDDDRWR